MEINVRFLDNLRLEASFDDFTITTDQPIRYKGDGTAPSPFDYFLASSALCAAYFVKVYCKARDIPTDDIRISQNNTIDPENRYNQIFSIKVELPADLPEKHREGILKAMDRCTVKKVIQTGPDFQIESVDTLGQDAGLLYSHGESSNSKTMILGKDAPLEETIQAMTNALAQLGIKIEIASWRNIVPHVWSVHIRDATSPLCFTNGKGSTKESALASALGEYLERISCNYFYNDFYLGEDIASRSFVHYPNEKWFDSEPDAPIPDGLMDDTMLSIYNPEGELLAGHLLDTNSGLIERGICAQPFIRQSDQETVYVPVGLVGNLYVSNGMSAGNSLHEARVQCLSEIFERAVKKQILEDELALPDVPASVLARYPSIEAGIKSLEERGFPLLVKDASLGGRFPVMCVTLMNPKTGGVYASFGAHPKFEVALERSLTELLQGRSFEGLNDMPAPTFNSLAVTEPNNFVEHFVDSTGVVSWKFFSSKSDYDFSDWNIEGNTKEEHDYLLDILKSMEKEVYIADYQDLGAHACRILVPGYSEIYPVEDLIWDNTNKALYFRSDILNIHEQDDEDLEDLLERFEESEQDNYTLISELIGIAFDENSVWGQLNIGELKIMIHLALQNLDQAKELVEELLTFNELHQSRRLYYQAIQTVLAISLDESIELDNYTENLKRMFGKEEMDQVIAVIQGQMRFHGLTPTDDRLSGLDKHQRLIESYEKLHKARQERM
ncbi:OsmC domain/YcaO domain-containing protein [Pseudobacteriovorax antillogorgiicola]|uniref:Ribosomal protein S12 methylthiotransferase accessory factor n=1 Tax=Pseudobacteriovorax antillogorgiicola TaxID=1513793 RepID=A0A1Y6BSA3_9BACT|nr:OsmC domain/YcaO domain-containing protein [Pseudobacteriovorax antillogorgiicola]TCS53180.1 ribosomal protein S12 methylthiotransferase accessory factor [Pseudobacteriovorax antillogorgiicola]SMF24556.1 ribosomal protein S12 methylthiotransferase accessory factor [Pseudobacteriovorax antillogorgiicola]